MDTLMLIFLLSDLKIVLSFHTVIYEYHAIDIAMTWSNAQQYCRTHYTDLATFRNMDEINSFQRPSSFSSGAWIGLFDDPASWKSLKSNESNSWRWSSTGTTSPGGYEKWLTNEPDYNSATNLCGLIRNGLWGDGSCGSVLPFVCFKASPGGSKQFTLSPTSMSWEDARSYCRTHYTDLAMIQDEAENTRAASVLVPNRWTWSGLYREPWRWSDGSDSQFKNWRSGEPNNLYGMEHCVEEQDTLVWNDKPCSAMQPFVCAKALKTKTNHIGLKLQSDVDLSDPTYSTQIIRQITLILQDMGLTDFKVKWNVLPRKVDKQT